MPVRVWAGVFFGTVVTAWCAASANGGFFGQEQSAATSAQTSATAKIQTPATAQTQTSANAQTQEDGWRKDLKPLIPPVVPLPPNSQLNPGTVGGTSNPYTTAPLQTPSTQAPTQPAPGLRLTIPSR